MPWYAIVYLVLAFVVSAASVIEDWREDPWWFSGGTIASFVCLALLVLGYFLPLVRDPLGWWTVVALLGFAVVWDTFELVRDTRQLRLKGEVLPIEEYLATVVVAALVLPGYLAGVSLVLSGQS